MLFGWGKREIERARLNDRIDAIARGVQHLNGKVERLSLKLDKVLDILETQFIKDKPTQNPVEFPFVLMASKNGNRVDYGYPTLQNAIRESKMNPYTVGISYKFSNGEFVPIWGRNCELSSYMALTGIETLIGEGKIKCDQATHVWTYLGQDNREFSNETFRGLMDDLTSATTEWR